jgi:hypothetical protein
LFAFSFLKVKFLIAENIAKVFYTECNFREKIAKSGLGPTSSTFLLVYASRISSKVLVPGNFVNME